MLSGITTSSTLGLSAPLDLFSKQRIISLVNQSRIALEEDAIAFSNGNENLAKGISMQLTAALDLYARNKELPVELNLGIPELLVIVTRF